MVQRHLSLSDQADQFIQEQIATGQFATPDEVVSKTLEEAQVAAAKRKLAELVREGLESGEGEEFTDEWFDNLMDQVQGEFERRNSA